MKRIFQILLFAAVLSIGGCIAPTQLKVTNYIDPINNDTTWYTNQQPLMSGAVLTQLVLSRASRKHDVIALELTPYTQPEYGFMFKGDSVSFKLTDGRVVKGYLARDSKLNPGGTSIAIGTWTTSLQVIFPYDALMALTETNVSLIQIRFSEFIFNATLSPENQHIIKNQFTLLGAKNIKPYIF